MNKKLIQDLAITGGIYDCICDPYDKLKNGDIYSSVMVDLERFAEKIVKKFDDILVLEHLDCVGNQDKQAAQRIDRLREKVKTYFGVGE